MSISAVVGKYKMVLGVLVLVILSAAPSVYYFRQYQNSQLKLNNPAEASKQQAKETIAAVGRLMMLPADEEPTVMEITDVAKLKDQPFFSHAANGDKVLIYTKSKRAILYRVSTNIIIDVAPVSIGNSATPSAQTPPAQATPSGTLKPTPKPASPGASLKK